MSACHVKAKLIVQHCMLLLVSTISLEHNDAICMQGGNYHEASEAVASSLKSRSSVLDQYRHYFGLNLTLSRLTFYFTRQQCSQTLAAAGELDLCN